MDGMPQRKRMSLPAPAATYTPPVTPPHDNAADLQFLAAFGQRKAVQDRLRKVDQDDENLTRQETEFRNERTALDLELCALEQQVQKVCETIQNLEANQKDLVTQRQHNQQERADLTNEAVMLEQGLSKTMETNPVLKAFFEFGVERGRKG